MNLMHTRATVKGQVLIPVALRRKYGITKGTRISITEEKGRIVLQPITRDFIHSLMGSLKGTGALEELMADRRRERDL
ncbi:MAG: AbrB/MazE/SpoVT family DNA-binding domain-containing protein [Bryobacterales bacterium]|nr:AbrB/MazE/SpoVT family DNA-binding domain-containing protein [Bryobacterales bacterium]